MRDLTTASAVRSLMRELGAVVRQPTRIYLTGGATAVLHGWRETTVDVDVKPVPDSDEVLRAIVRLKEQLSINIELASPDDFIPELPGWEERSTFIAQEGTVSFFHYDPYAQALSKIERAHARDREDVRHMIEAGLVDRNRLIELFELIEPLLHRFPAIDPGSFRARVLDAVRTH